jgi:DNA-binding GntR family transcriptional regulator
MRMECLSRGDADAVYPISGACQPLNHFAGLSYRGSEPTAQHKALLKAALKRDAATAAETLRAHVGNCVEHALAMAALK